MRFLTGFFIVMLSSVLAGSQQNGPREQHVATPEELIKTAITSGGWDGHMQKQFGKMGDAAAVVVTKVVAERNLSATEIDSVLAILATSFADPALVEGAADREPRAALFVLRFLDLQAPDSGTKRKIADTRTYIREQFAKYTAKLNKDNGKPR